MALSQDEQRMLAEIERRLAADDPGLASCLTTFRRPGPATVLRSPRARIIGSLFTVLLVAMVSLMIYAMIPFRTHMPSRHAQLTTTAGAPASTATSPATSSQPNHTQVSSATVSTSAKSTTSLSATNRASASMAPDKAQATQTKRANGEMPPEPSLQSGPG
jgi:cytoskeletal protein RodZ